MTIGIPLFLFLIVLSLNSVFAYRLIHMGLKDTLIVYMENETITITCATRRDMSYCRLLDPKGNKFSFTDTLLQDGNCTTQIQGTKENAGFWSCEVGYSVGELEEVEKYELRLSGEVAAVIPEVQAKRGQDTTLYCITTREAQPLNICRIEMPSGQAFLIDKRVTVKNKIMGRYFFPPDKYTDQGECAVTIKSVTKNDEGKWTCEVGVGDSQSTSIQLTVKGFSFEWSNIIANVIVVIVVIVFLTCLILVFRYFRGKTMDLSPPITEPDIELNSFTVTPPEEQLTPTDPASTSSVAAPSSPVAPASPGPSGSSRKLLPSTKC